MPYLRQLPDGIETDVPVPDTSEVESPPQFFGLEALLAHSRSLWERAEVASETLVESLGWPDWLTSVHVVFRSHKRPVVIEVGVVPGWQKPVRLPPSVDGFPVEVVARERAVLQMEQRE